jgi:hypothetical protein
MLLLIDNYDSFTYNLVHFLGELGASCDVVRNDKLTADEALTKKPKAIVLSPGPCTPNEAGICLDLVEKAAGRIRSLESAFGTSRSAKPTAEQLSVPRQCMANFPRSRTTILEFSKDWKKRSR